MRKLQSTVNRIYLFTGILKDNCLILNNFFKTHFKTHSQRAKLQALLKNPTALIVGVYDTVEKVKIVLNSRICRHHLRHLFSKYTHNSLNNRKISSLLRPSKYLDHIVQPLQIFSQYQDYLKKTNFQGTQGSSEQRVRQLFHSFSKGIVHVLIFCTTQSFSSKDGVRVNHLETYGIYKKYM